MERAIGHPVGGEIGDVEIAREGVRTFVPLTRAQELEDVDALYRVYGARVERYFAFSLRDTDAAATLTQDCFLRAWQTRERFRGDCSVATWLMRIACNLVRDHTRTEKFKFWKQTQANAIDVGAVSEKIAGRQASAEAGMLAKERLTQVMRALDELSARQRSLFLLRFVEEMNLDEIAEATGLSAGTVKSHLHRALTAVRKAEGGTR
jgi:RNA polymerase sigma-70 factor (ECF subfamily)